MAARMITERYDPKDKKPNNYNWYAIVEDSANKLYQSGPHRDVDFGHHLAHPVSDISIGLLAIAAPTADPSLFLYAALIGAGAALAGVIITGVIAAIRSRGNLVARTPRNSVKSVVRTSSRSTRFSSKVGLAHVTHSSVSCLPV
jgi:hypothetical protein